MEIATKRRPNNLLQSATESDLQRPKFHILTAPKNDSSATKKYIKCTGSLKEYRESRNLLCLNSTKNTKYFKNMPNKNTSDMGKIEIRYIAKKYHPMIKLTKRIYKTFQKGSKNIGHRQSHIQKAHRTYLILETSPRIYWTSVYQSCMDLYTQVYQANFYMVISYIWMQILVYRKQLPMQKAKLANGTLSLVVSCTTFH